MQGDGNLVLYSGSSAVLWDSATSGTGAYVYLGDDGNLEVEAAAGSPLWGAPGILAPGAELTASKSLSSPNGAYRLVMQGDGNLVEYTSANAVVWDSATSGSGAYLVMHCLLYTSRCV